MTPPCVTTAALVVPERSSSSTSCSNAEHTRYKNARLSSPFGGAACCPLSIQRRNAGSLSSSLAVLPSQSPKSHSRRPSSSTGFASGYRICIVCTQRVRGLL